MLLRDRKSGLAGAANWVVSEAGMPLVAVAHADDISAPGRLEGQMSHMSARPDAALIGGSCRGIDASGACVHPPNLWRVLRPSAFAAFAHSSIMFRRESYIAAGGYREQAQLLGGSRSLLAPRSPRRDPRDARCAGRLPILEG